MTIRAQRGSDLVPRPRTEPEPGTRTIGGAFIARS
jgi:hypothetical protein